MRKSGQCCGTRTVFAISGPLGDVYSSGTKISHRRVWTAKKDRKEDEEMGSHKPNKALYLRVLISQETHTSTKTK